MADNMRIWDQVKTTDPHHTKSVRKPGMTITAISAQYQIMRATKVFGPVGEGWGYDVTYNYRTDAEDPFVLAMVTIWHRTPDGQPCSFGPIVGCNPLYMKTKSGRFFDDDAGKKAMTDALTKGLSHLGFSADVFLGMYDDSKYVAELDGQFADEATNVARAANDRKSAKPAKVDLNDDERQAVIDSAQYHLDVLSDNPTLNELQNAKDWIKGTIDPDGEGPPAYDALKATDRKLCKALQQKILEVWAKLDPGTFPNRENSRQTQAAE